MTRLFHAIAPFPECCGGQMRLAGNMNMHTLSFQCYRCFKYLEVSVQFNENPRREPDAKTLAATDATP